MAICTLYFTKQLVKRGAVSPRRIIHRLRTTAVAPFGPVMFESTTRRLRILAGGSREQQGAKLISILGGEPWCPSQRRGPCACLAGAPGSSSSQRASADRRWRPLAPVASLAHRTTVTRWIRSLQANANGHITYPKRLTRPSPASLELIHRQTMGVDILSVADRYSHH